MSDSFVIDANFFISLAQSHEAKAIEDALALAGKQGWRLHTTARVLAEVATVRDWGTRTGALELAERLMAVGKVDEGALSALRASLGGPTRSPQDTDLSLMVLSEDLARRGERVRLVSDDFKISTSSREHGMPYAVISPSVFLFILSRLLQGDDREEVRRLFRKVRHGEMEYLLSRRDLYNVEEKLTWLMDNLLSTVTAQALAADHEERHPSAPGAGSGTGVGGTGEGDAAPASPSPSKEGEADWAALLRHLRGEHVRQGHLTPFKDILPHLEPLTGLRPALLEIQSLAVAGELEAALARAHEVLSELKGALQMAVGEIGRAEGLRVLRAYAEMLPDIEMVSALIHVNLGEVVDCEDHLDNVALLALAAGLKHTTIEVDYLEALVHSYREAWPEARAQFELTARLSKQAGEDAIGLRCIVGAAVTQFLSGDKEAADRTMTEVNAQVERDPGAGSVALEEFGDHFTNFGATHLASGLYDEALECAVEARDTPRAERLLGKLRRSHLAMGLDQRELAGALRALIDHANDIQDAELRAKYEEMERKLRAEEETMAGPLEPLLPEWSPVGALPSGLQGLLEIVRAEALPSNEGTLLVCYSQSVGMVGLLVKSRVYMPGIEQAHVTIGEGARVRLVEPPEALKKRHSIRGLIVLREGDPFQLRRDLISLRA